MTKAQQTRLLTWRLKMLQRPGDGWTVARTCRHFGISRKTFYKWKKRREANFAEREVGSSGWIRNRWLRAAFARG